ncbi:MAG: type II toxin-antitoxin system RelE/ParE family toxin [Helicobacteraceae bacterium]|nr:type II toxin-antitoxin system RelE/ParE family toxin [Helicobacteraceae bacterium]
MIIEKSPTYNDRLFAILKYISKNNPTNAKQFKKDLDSKILNLVNMPYKFRASVHYSDNEVRDLVFKGYTVPYLIDEQNDKLIVLDVFKWLTSR